MAPILAQPNQINACSKELYINVATTSPFCTPHEISLLATTLESRSASLNVKILSRIIRSGLSP